MWFIVRICAESDVNTIKAVMSVAVGADHHSSVLSALKNIPEVNRIYSTHGRWNYVVEMRGADLSALGRALTDIQAVRAYPFSEMSVLLHELR